VRRGFSWTFGDARTIGARLRQSRDSRRKSLRVVAGLAGMLKSHLSEIERGGCVLDRISEVVALAGALQIAPSELMRLSMPAPANGHADSTMRVWRNGCRRSTGSWEPQPVLTPTDDQGLPH
jgi:transcriptional regulator with XRE-family HTH domain